MTTRPAPAPGAATTAAPGVTGCPHPGAVALPSIAKARSVRPPLFAPRSDTNVSTTQNPRDEPGGQHDSCGGTRVEVSLPAGELLDAALHRLVSLTDDELNDVVTGLDAALASTRHGPSDGELEDAITIAAAGRILLRRRRAAAGRTRALSIVRQLVSTMESTE